jgi:hypothetical protein
MCETCNNITSLQGDIMKLTGAQLACAFDVYNAAKVSFVGTHPEYVVAVSAAAMGDNIIPFDHFVGGTTDQAIPHNTDPLVDKLVADIRQQLEI